LKLFVDLAYDLVQQTGDAQLRRFFFSP
jgi:hypothetical protein